MTDIKNGTRGEPKKSGLRRVAATLTMLVIGSVLLSACVVYPAGRYPHGYYYGGGWYHHGWDR